MKQDYYELLGIDKSANEDDIKRAYRVMVKKYHPDNNLGDKQAEEKMKSINEAYGVLKDPQKRAQYDQFGHAADGGGFGGFDFGGGFGGFGGFDFSDILNELEGFGLGGRGRRRRAASGKDIEETVQIDFEDAIFGIEREIEISVRETCDTCNGSGAAPGTTPISCQVCNGTGQINRAMQTQLGIMQMQSPCNVCHGKGKVIKDPCPTCRTVGKVTRRKKIAVNIPKGIDHGEAIRYTGHGEAGDFGAPKGNLYVRISIRPHKIYSRRGMTLYMDKEISFAQAALGAEISIQTPYGDTAYNVSAGTQPDSIITLRNKGVPQLQAPQSQSNRIGDLVVTLKIAVPRSLSDTQKDLLRKFAEEDGETVENGKKGFFNKFKK